MRIITDEKKIDEILTRGVEDVIVLEDLKEKLLSGKQLRIKFGIDPTMPDLHLGHSVPLRKLKQFQDLGHKIILIIGDYTAMVGDPTGRTETRKVLTKKEVRLNMKNYLKQATKILNFRKTEIKHNSKWLNKGLQIIISLTQAGTVNQMLRRADFKERFDKDLDITVLELMYPLMQGYDSVAIKADVELGGTDQKFNLLTGRKVQRHFNLPEQDIITLPLLEGLDGVKKMSKSYGNYISLDEDPKEMFGKTMSIPDELIKKYTELCTNLSVGEKNQNPRDAKIRLAYEIVRIYHNEAKAHQAQENWENTFSKGQIPSNTSKIENQDQAIDVLVSVEFIKSKTEARRLLEAGSVTDLDVNKKLNLKDKFKSGHTYKVGKHHFIKIK